GTGTVDLTLATDHPADPSSPVAIVGLPATYSPASGTFQVGDRYTLTGTITAAVTNSPSPGLTRLTLANASPAGVTQVDVPNPTTFTYAINDTYTGSLKITKIEAKTGAIVSSADGNSIKVAANVTPAFDDTHTDFECLNTYVSGTIQATERSTEYQHNNKFVNDIILNTRSGTALSGLVAATYSAGNTFYPSVTTTVAVYDSLGAKHSVPVVFTKQENNKWKLTLGTGSDAFEITDPDGTKTAVGLTKTDLKFDTSGAYISGSASLKLSYSNGAAPQQVSLNLAAITQYSGTSTIAADSDGNAAGTLSNVDIDSQGVITGTYTNGVRQKEAQIAMAQFNNPSGLTKLGGNLYQESNNTGTRTISGAADIGTELTTSALEMANVDLADQFSDMIITQRGFQSNSKMITVSDEMLETLINMKR
ncbi:flagellar hook-basal body complex protein, partial [uncultured Selenomonas sp.]